MMEQPAAATAAAATDIPTIDVVSENATSRPPVPEQILAHYECTGLGTSEAALEAVGNLQALLYGSLASSRSRKKHFMTESPRKLDNANAHLAILESKPSLGQSFAIGLGSGAFLRGAEVVLPHVLGGLQLRCGRYHGSTAAKHRCLKFLGSRLEFYSLPGAPLLQLS